MRLRIILLVAMFWLMATPTFAKYDPTGVANNKFGIHIVDVNDIADAATLVNSNGGDWGYVTLVIQEDNRDFDKWQRVFDQMRRLHLIPIVRLATHVVGSSWVIPSRESAEDWARFLDSLNWPTENRYIVLFNEPNHANEWGGRLDPEGFADTIVFFTEKLHQTSEDFFVMPGAMDNSAASDGQSLDAAVYWSRMITQKPEVFTDIDGWSSHAYPNPGFSGSPYAIGRGTLYSYQWERGQLQKLGINRTLPIFITETGWVHSQGVIQNPGLLTPNEVGNNLKIAAQSAWQTPSILAVTPFVLNYQAYPFDHFSWRKLGSPDYYPHFAAYQDIAKVAGLPHQRERFAFEKRIIPNTLVTGSTYTLTGILKNSGQSILTEQDGYSLQWKAGDGFHTVFEPLPLLEPKQSGTVTLHIETPVGAASYAYTLELSHHEQTTVIESGTVQLVPPPSVTVSINMGWRTRNDAAAATVLVYDRTALIHKVNGVRFIHGEATVTGLRNIVPEKQYRIVILVPFYLPRQTIATVSARNTKIHMSRLYPLDFDQDGRLSFSDILAVLRLKPNFIISLFIGP